MPVGDVPLNGFPGELLVALGNVLLPGLVPVSGFALVLGEVAELSAGDVEGEFAPLEALPEEAGC